VAIRKLRKSRKIKNTRNYSTFNRGVHSIRPNDEYNITKGTVVTYLCVLLPDFSMLSTSDLGVEIAIVLSGDSACISLSTDLDTLGIH